MVEDEDDGAELEEEELESVQVSETEFNFLDFIKKWANKKTKQFEPFTVCLYKLNLVSEMFSAASSLSLFLLDSNRFANPAVVRPYLLLLKSYSRNTPHTNHCIARMLHRVAVDLKMDALIFQLSAFYIFNKILSDPAAAAYQVQ